MSNVESIELLVRALGRRLEEMYVGVPKGVGQSFLDALLRSYAQNLESEDGAWLLMDMLLLEREYAYGPKTINARAEFVKKLKCLVEDFSLSSPFWQLFKKLLVGKLAEIRFMQQQSYEHEGKRVVFQPSQWVHTSPRLFEEIKCNPNPGDVVVVDLDAKKLTFYDVTTTLWRKTAKTAFRIGILNAFRGAIKFDTPRFAIYDKERDQFYELDYFFILLPFLLRHPLQREGVSDEKIDRIIRWVQSFSAENRAH